MNGRLFPDERRDIVDDMLLLPEEIIDENSGSVGELLRPSFDLFDLIWNASGYNRSPNFDQDGNWAGK